MSLSAFNRHIETLLSENSKRACADWTGRFEEWRLLHKKSFQEDQLVRNFATSLVQEGKANSSVRTACAWIRKYLTWLGDNGTEVAEQKRLELPKTKIKKRFTPTKDQVHEVIIACKGIPEPYGHVIALIAHLGMRDTEIHTLRYDDWNMGKDRRVVFTLKNTKNGRERIVPLLREGEKLFSGYILHVRKDMLLGKNSPWLFPQQKDPSKHLLRKNVEFYMRQLRKNMNMPELTCHSLRRYYVTNLMRNGVREIDIANIIGHSDMRTFKLYYQPTDEDLSNALGSL